MVAGAALLRDVDVVVGVTFGGFEGVASVGAGARRAGVYSTGRSGVSMFVVFDVVVAFNVVVGLELVVVFNTAFRCA